MDAERPRETVDEIRRRVCAQLRGSELTKRLTTEAAERYVEYLTRLLASARRCGRNSGGASPTPQPARAHATRPSSMRCMALLQAGVPRR